MNGIDAVLADHRLLPVLTVAGRENGVHLGRALQSGGLSLAEVTLRVDGSLDALRAMASLDVMVGAGTVVSVEQVDQVVEAGAAFVVSPGFYSPVLDRCRELGVPAVPGVATATEMMRAVGEGFRTVKMFPAGLLGGPAAVKAFAGPFGSLRFVPTGGVKPETVAAYLSCPNVLAVGGSWMAPPELIAAGSWDDITQRAREAVDQIQQDHGGHVDDES